MNGCWAATLRGRSAILVGVSTLCAVAGAAGSAPPPKPSTTLTDGITETLLSNGLRVLTKEVRSAPIVSFSVWYKVGSRNEHTGITGVSHLVEHMMFKGTRTYRVGEIARTLFVLLANGPRPGSREAIEAT